MRKVEIGTSKYTTILCLDEPSIIGGGACHEYEVASTEPHDPSVPYKKDTPLDGFKGMARISFQNGPVKQYGVNGCHNEDLIAIVIDRLQHFQDGEFKCRENALALTKLEEAMHWLRHRTDARIARGVEGTNQK